MKVQLGKRLLTVLACLFIMLAGISATSSALAQSGTQDISIWTYENDGSGSAYDACYVLLGYSQEGCDLNGDGAVLFEDVAYGTYTVSQTRDLGPGRYVSDFTITVNGGVPDFAAFVITETSQPGDPSTGSRDLFIATVANDASYYDACYVLVGYSLEGCDDNGDGYVLFEDVAYGTYVVRQTADISPYWIADFTIEFNANTDNVFYAFLETSGPAPVEMTDVNLITRNPANGQLLMGACYELVGYSNIGCDENRDGQVEFKDIPLGEYTVRQTTAPRGFQRIDNVKVGVTATWDYLGLVVQQEKTQSDGTTDHLSLVFVDGVTFERVVDPNICARLVNGTQQGCDDSLVDGQIDFLKVKHGDYRLEVSGLPAGYTLWYPNQPITVDRGDQYPNTVWYVFLMPAN